MNCLLPQDSCLRSSKWVFRNLILALLPGGGGRKQILTYLVVYVCVCACVCVCVCFLKNLPCYSWVQWLTSVIPTLWEAKAGRS